MERATLNTRTGDGVVPMQLRRWLAAQGFTLAQWRQDQQRKQDPAVTALALRRRRLALKR